MCDKGRVEDELHFVEECGGYETMRRERRHLWEMMVEDDMEKIMMNMKWLVRRWSLRGREVKEGGVI